MSERPAHANPEYLFHYEQLRRTRVVQRRRGYAFLIAAGLLLAATIWLASAVPVPIGLQGAILPLILFTSLFIILLWRGLIALKQGYHPIGDAEVARRRQEDRRQLFQFAQGHRPWHHWGSVAVQGLLGLCFLFLGGDSTWIAIHNLSNPHLAEIVLSFPFLLAGGYYLSKAISGARLLGRLKEPSSRELADRLSLGEITQGE